MQEVMKMNMLELIAWLAGMVVTMLGVGFGLKYQGKYLLAAENEKENEEKNKKIRRDSARLMKDVGVAVLCIGVFFLVVIIPLVVFMD